MDFIDPRSDGRMPSRGPVRMYHASEDLPGTFDGGLRAGSDGVVWLATTTDIADLHAGGTQARTIRTVVEVEVEAADLFYERSHDETHVFYAIAGDLVNVIEANAWP